MNRTHPITAYQRNKGFSLIELMVSLTIGLVIAIAAMSAYLGAASSGKMADAQSRMNEDAQAALAILSQQIRMAGNNPIQAGRASVFNKNPVYDSAYVGGTSTTYGTNTFTITPTYTLSNFIVRGCDGNFNNIKTAGGNLDGIDTTTCAATTSTLPDSIGVSYEADRYNTIPTSSGAATDCLGNALTAYTVSFPAVTPTVAMSATFTVADNRFFVGTSTAIVSPSLYCKGNGGGSTAQPLVENIEDMQLTYGTVSTTATETTATVAGYLRADEIANLTTTPADAQTRWGKVLTVRICVLVRSEAPVATDANAARYDDCHDNQNVAAPDLRLRRAYWTTVVLRNRRS